MGDGMDMKYIGLLATLFAVFIFGMIVGTEPLKLAILLIVGGLVFLVITTKENVAVMGFTVLIFALLFYLMYPMDKIANFTIKNPSNYFSILIVIAIILVALIVAYKGTSGK